MKQFCSACGKETQCSTVQGMTYCGQCYLPAREAAAQNQKAKDADSRDGKERRCVINAGHHIMILGGYNPLPERRVSIRRRLLSAPEIEMLLGDGK